jgi:hypothetical protein
MFRSAKKKNIIPNPRLWLVTKAPAGGILLNGKVSIQNNQHQLSLLFINSLTWFAKIL